MWLKKSFLLAVVLLMSALFVSAQDQLVLGDTLTVDASGAEMEFVFDALAGDELVISAVSEDFDTLINILDAQGDVVASDDDSGERFNAEVTFTVPADDTYTVVVSDAFGQELSGTFDLSLSEASAMIEEPIVEEPTFEPMMADDCASAASGDSISMNMCYAGVADDEIVTFSLDLEAGQFVVLTAESDEFDTYLELVLDGEVVDEDDDSAGNLNSQISYTADASGTYEVNLNGAFGRNADGAYILMVGEAVSMTDVSTEATAIESGMEVDGEYNGEYVNYSFYAEAGTLYIITLTSPDFDTYLELYDANDNYMAEDDDSAGSGTDSLIRFSANDSGTYVIKVRSFGMSGSGSYNLSLETVQSVSLTIGEPYVIEADANERNFTFEASADLIYDLYAISDGDDDTYMTLYGPSGEQLGYDDDNGHGYNPFMRALNLPESGMYRLEVGSYSGDDLTSDLTIYLEESDRLFIDEEPTTFVAGERADIEVVAFEVKAGETYRLTVELERNDLYIYGDMLQPEESGMNYSAGSFSLSNMPRGVFDMVAEYDGIMRVQIDFGLYDEETTNVTVSVIRVTDN